MPPFIPFTDCVEVVCEGEMAGQAAFLTLGFTLAGGYVGSDLQDLADGVADWLSAQLTTHQQAGITWNLVKATDLTTQFAPVAVSVQGLPAVGAVSGAAVPSNCCLVMSFKTGARGRSFRGRNYIPSIPSARLASTTEWDTTALTQFHGDYSGMVATYLPPGNTHVILSRFLNGVRRTTGVATAVTDYIARAAVGTQRRRIIGHGI